MFNKTKAQEVYVITYLPTGKKYVGKSSDVKMRFETHFHDLAGHRHSSKGMQADYDTYDGGMESFKVEIVGEQSRHHSAKDDLEHSTMIALRTYDERYGYNDHDQAMQRVREENGLPLSHAGIIKNRNRPRKVAKKKKYHSIGTVSVKAARIAANLSRAELAKKMGVCQATIANWENDKYGMNAEKLMAFCMVTGFEANSIICPGTSSEKGEAI